MASDDSLDIEVVSSSVASRNDALEAIMRRYNQRLFRLARAILKDGADAEDVLQECYIKVHRHLPNFEGRSHLSTWLSGVVINESLGALRKRKRDEAISKAAEHDNQTDAGRVAYLASENTWEPEEHVERRDLRMLLERAVDSLPDRFRVVFVMRMVEEMSIKETAAVLNIPRGTVKTREFRAKRLLRAELGGRFEPVFKQTFPFLGSRCDRIVNRVMGRMATL